MQAIEQLESPSKLNLWKVPQLNVEISTTHQALCKLYRLEREFRTEQIKSRASS